MANRQTYARPTQTTFLVSNLHCPSCVKNIEAALKTLRPSPYLVSHSIINHTLIIEHQHSIVDVVDLLEDQGYEIDTILDRRGVPYSRYKNDRGRTHAVPGFYSDYINQKHKQNCEQCRNEKPHVAEADAKGKHISDLTLDSVVSHSVDSNGHFEASLSVEGMTCAVCVGHITHALEQQPWVTKVGVNLLGGSAKVTFRGKEHADKIVEEIEDLGFEAKLESVTSREQTSSPDDLFQASLSVEGMTCAVCVGHITTALEGQDWIIDVGVSLISKSAKVTFRGQENADKIVEEIEDLGFEAKIEDMKKLDTSAQKSGKSGSRRTVDILVTGIYCAHCPGRIEAALKNLSQGKIKVEKRADVQDPIMRLTYVPKSPSFTIRQILTAIAAVDPAFKPSIFHPPTIEERAREMHRKEQRRLLFRFILSGIVAIPTFILGIVFMSLLPKDNPGRMWLMAESTGVARVEWILFVLATPVYFFAADVFHRRAIKELRTLWHPRSKVPVIQRFYRFGSMSTLISFGSTIAYFSSIAELSIAASQRANMIGDDAANSSYFDTVVFLSFFLLGGRLIEARSKTKSGDAVAALGKLRPNEAILVTDDKSDQKVPVDLLDVGDLVRIPHGASPPCDGTMVTDSGTFDESSLTGESRPIAKKDGDEVFAGTLNKGGPVLLRITGAAGGSMLDQIITAVRDGQTKRAPVERIVDVLTGYFVPVITLVAIITWIVWLSLGVGGHLPASYLDTSVGGWPFWSLQFAIAVFVVACPCGIGLAAPTALFVGGGLAAKHGILVKGGGEAFQEASTIDCIVFDKTGTLTVGGEPKVTDYVVTTRDLPKEDMLAAVLALESGSSHPIARALVSFAKDRGASSATIKSANEIPGKGMSGSIVQPSDPTQTLDILIGNLALMTDHSIPLTRNNADRLTTWSNEAKSVVLIATRTSPSSQYTLTTLLSISDPLRPEALATITHLQSLGKRVHLLSGDNPLTAHAVGRQLGIPPSQITAGVLPAQKADVLRSLRASLTPPKGKVRATVAMVGDGINDAPALAAADVGIAIGSGADVAVSAAHFVLVRSDLRALGTLVALSRCVFRRIRFNFFWAVVYNCLAVPVAAGVLYPLKTAGGGHVRLDPAFAALVMAASSISVVGSSLAMRSGIWGLGFREGK